MSSYQRATLPENFYDVTSDMLLVQPEPQYLYAQLWLTAMGASLNPGGDFGLMGRQLPTPGAAYSGAERDRLELSGMLPSQIISAKVDFNAKPGNTIRINRPQFTNSTYSEASRKIVSGATISQTGITITSEQTNLTLYRFGGPYSGGSVVPYAIESFDANMGVHQAASIHGTHLKRDCHRFLDSVQTALLDQAAVAVYPDGMTADDDALAVGDYPFTMEEMSRTEQLMDDANLPTFGDGFRMLVLTPRQCKQLKDDPAFQKYSEFHPQFNALFPQYLKTAGKFHIFKSTTLSSPANSHGINIDRGHAIAPGALMAGMGRPLRVMPNTNDNYGETVLVVWLGDLAFGLADNRFVYSVRSSA